MVKDLTVKVIYGMILPHLTATASSHGDEFLHRCLLGGLLRLHGLYIHLVF